MQYFLQYFLFFAILFTILSYFTMLFAILEEFAIHIVMLWYFLILKYYNTITIQCYWNYLCPPAFHFLHTFGIYLSVYVAIKDEIPYSFNESYYRRWWRIYYRNRNRNMVYYFKVYVGLLHTISRYHKYNHYMWLRPIGSLVLLRGLVVRVIEKRPRNA